MMPSGRVTTKQSCITSDRAGSLSSKVLQYSDHLIAGVPGGLVGGPRAYQDQIRGFKSHRVHARSDFFLHKTMISGKRESVS